MMADLRTLATDPKDFNALIGAGNAALDLGDTMAAAGFFGRAEEVGPNNPLPQAGMGAAMVAQADAQGALVYFQRAEAPLETADDDDGDELVLESDDILTSPVMANPIAPPADEDDATLHGNPGTDEPRAPRESGTLFERMSNIARGSAQARADDDQAAPGFRREPLDIPGFLNRQNNR